MDEQLKVELGPWNCGQAWMDELNAGREQEPRSLPKDTSHQQHTPAYLPSLSSLLQSSSHSPTSNWIICSIAHRTQGSFLTIATYLKGINQESLEGRNKGPHTSLGHQP